ncbi:acyltransferase domain-containing protein [Streptomyces sp. M19]
MVLAMRHGQVPPTLHARNPSTQVDWASGTVRLATEPTAWPTVDRPAGPPSRRSASAAPTGTWSWNRPHGRAGAGRGAVRTGRTRDRRTGGGAVGAVGPEPAVVARPGGAAARLDGPGPGRRRLLAGDDQGGAGTPRRPGGRPRRRSRRPGGGRAAPALVQGTARSVGDTVFVFPGQGSQWVGMAVELLDSSPVFAARMAECGQALSAFVDWSLLDVVRAGEFEQVDVVQPVLWAVMVSLAEVWKSVGVTPDAVVGHSQGRSRLRWWRAGCRWRTARGWSLCGAVRSGCWRVVAGWCRWLSRLTRYGS